VARWTRIRSIDVHPQLWPSRKLLDEGATAEELFAKQASAVTELYSMHLAHADPVPAQTWWIRLKPVVAAHATRDFQTEPTRVSWSAGEVFNVAMDRAILDLPDDQRPGQYLDWLQRHLTRLAAARDWPVTGFEQAYAKCREDGVSFVWRGAPKASPNRRFAATPAYHFDSNGDCWASLLVQDRAEELVAQAGPWDCFPELRWIRRSARALRWIDSTHVHLPVWPEEFAAAWGLAPAYTLALDETLGIADQDPG